MKTLSQYIAENSKQLGVEKKLVQGRVPLKILKQVARALKKRRVTWTDLITASMVQFLDETAELGTKTESAEVPKGDL